MDEHYHWNVFHSSWPLAVAVVVLTFAFFFMFFRPYSTKPDGVRLAELTLLVSCPLMAICAMLFVSGLWQLWIEYRMRGDGHVTDASVVGDRITRTQPGESNPRDYTYIVIEFEDDAGRVWRVEREVEEGQPWSRLNPGDRPGAIEYLHSDPETWRFADEAGLCWRLLLASGAVGMAIVGLRCICGLASYVVSLPTVALQKDARSDKA
jgi:hypothetical protein